MQKLLSPYPAILLIVLWMFPPTLASGQESVALSTVEEIAADFSGVPCRNQDRLEGVRALFLKYGAPPDAIAVESYRNAQNLLIIHEGLSPETVVLGAHHDLVEFGCGAVDNWTGVVALAHLYRIIRTSQPAKRILFVAFGGEERGLIGSAGMADSIPPDQRSHYCAMLNLDSFGLAAPLALENISSPALLQLAAETARNIEAPFDRITISRADSDSTAFRRRGIPAITLTGLSDAWPSILHTVADQADRVHPGSVYLGYRLALAMWAEIDQAPCDAYR